MYKTSRTNILFILALIITSYTGYFLGLTALELILPYIASIIYIANHKLISPNEYKKKYIILDDIITDGSFGIFLIILSSIQFFTNNIYIITVSTFSIFHVFLKLKSLIINPNDIISGVIINLTTIAIVYLTPQNYLLTRIINNISKPHTQFSLFFAVFISIFLTIIIFVVLKINPYYIALFSLGEEYFHHSKYNYFNYDKLLRFSKSIFIYGIISILGIWGGVTNIISKNGDSIITFIITNLYFVLLKFIFHNLSINHFIIIALLLPYVIVLINFTKEKWNDRTE